MEVLDLLLVIKESDKLNQLLEKYDNTGTSTARVSAICKAVIGGSYLHAMNLFSDTELSLPSLLEACTEAGDVFGKIRIAVLKYISDFNDNERNVRRFELLLLGIAYLELYCQVNYTGPELPPSQLSVFTASGKTEFCVRELECDGSFAFRTIEIPQTLLFARIILSAIANQYDASWREGITVDADGIVSRRKLSATETISSEQTLLSANWWSARAAVVHLRLLQKQTYDDVPTLWQEVQERFSLVLSDFASWSKDVRLATVTAAQSTATAEEIGTLAVGCGLAAPTDAPDHLISSWPRLSKQFATQAWLEWGLCCLHFGYGDKGKRCFAVAKVTAGLEVEMTASMGKRTKHQHSEYAQLFLYAKSSLVPDSSATTSPPVEPVQSKKVLGEVMPPAAPTEAPEHPDGWQHSEWELGRRMVREDQSGEEVAVREVLLDSMDGGAVENIVLEGGPKFSGELDKGGVLHPVDQAIILALCLDVSNSNPIDGLTNEEMQPYVERVLGLATNWMIHSTALLERSWLEFERRKTMDRAMLQIQALIDQHTTKLTLMQSTYKSIEESAPVQDRIRYLYSIVYPAQYELKRDLAVRYLRCQVFMSALNYFRELEMWDEVVTCYQLMEKPQRAEIVVREQLTKAGETPYMLTSLADLTGKEEYYERAWAVSKGRFPRAKRTLGKICFDRGDFENCVMHLDQALSVHPLVATAWYLRGIACMRLDRWDDAIQSFVRCVQQDMEIGEAWANIGAVNMHLRSWPKAYEALNEALRHKQDSWRILENLMTVALALGKWRDAIRFMQRLLELRHKSDRPVHKDELRHLCFIVSSQAQREAKVKAKAMAAAQAAGESTSETDSTTAATAPPPPTDAVLAALKSLREILQEDPEFDEDDMSATIPISTLADVPAQVDKLLTNITQAVPSDAEIWDVYAEFQHTLGRFRLELECRTKQFRKLTSEDAWEKSAEKITAITNCAKLLVRAHHFKEVSKTDFYTCKMILQTAQRRVDGGPLSTPEEKAVLDTLVAKMSSISEAL